jgi:hypothetical protein
MIITAQHHVFDDQAIAKCKKEGLFHLIPYRDMADVLHTIFARSTPIFHSLSRQAEIIKVDGVPGYPSNYTII